ncbi:MAG TPA: type II toxin-antitoxin system Phd/YefM family antitoxin [Bryobacteraceae bacterium]|jgi:prevent-host-death family protein
MKERVLSATEFKAKCLSYLDEVERVGEQITITKRGKPVAVLGPVKGRGWKSPANSWAGRMEIVGDIINTPWEWDCLREGEE